MKRSTLLTAALLSSLVVSGCYHYVPPVRTPIPQGTPVRLELERPMSFEIPAVTFHNIGRVTGEMVRQDGGEVVLSALWMDAVTGEGFNGQLWTIHVPEANVTSLTVRSVSRWRTAGFFVGGIVATYLGFRALGGSEATGTQPGSGGTTR